MIYETYSYMKENTETDDKIEIYDHYINGKKVETKYIISTKDVFIVENISRKNNENDKR